MNDATIIRTQRDKDHPYIILNKTFANDRRLSWEARGMMTFFLSKPDDWQIWPKTLIKESPAGRDAVYRILKELELAGYLTRRQVTSAGKFGTVETIISEVPAHTDAFDRALLSRKRTKDQPYTEKPDTDQPYTEKPEHTNKGSVPSTDSTNKSTTTMQNTPSGAYAPGGGGVDLKTEAEAYLYRCGVKAKSKRRTLAARLTLAQIEQAWTALVALNAQRRAKGLVELGGGHFADTLEALASAPADTTAPAANLPRKPKAPYLTPEWAAWTDQQRDDATEAYSADLRRYDLAIARAAQ